MYSDVANRLPYVYLVRLIIHDADYKEPSTGDLIRLSYLQHSFKIGV